MTADSLVGAVDPLEAADRGRRLFRYLLGDEWTEYRAILAVFAGTFFAEFTPDDVTAALARDGVPLDRTVVADRLERLRDWGNLTVSSSVGQPSSLADYYKRRNLYLITREGQEVYSVVEGVLRHVDEVRDVSAGRLRALLDALSELASSNIATMSDERLGDLVRTVFDSHAAFADEITQFSASINQWQSRYDLSEDEFRFFAEVLVGYVGERLDEIERIARPIGRQLAALHPNVVTLVGRVQHGLAGRIERAGLSDAIAVTRTPGSDTGDWEHLALWFVATAAGPSRLDRLSHDAIVAIRTLTLNLTRLSRFGMAAASRRSDFLRLAHLFNGAGPADVARIAVAAFGLHPSRHFGALADDVDDPESPTTSWWSAPKARVPISVRARGDSTNRGRPSPLADRSAAHELLRRRREDEQRARDRVDNELLTAGTLDGAELSSPALRRLQDLLGRSTHGASLQADERVMREPGLTCRVRRLPGAQTTIHTVDGTLTLVGIDVVIEPPDRVGEPAGGELGPAEPVR
ncbi:TIGR02677 family protein [Desertimonas flava]|uniref:TIGR02677 family protein n=1 Tax=Desertimonas flava TaxID=2064846 RepID=UPI000E34E5AC|nr:TIGR02677 family protein [Desertimonas flava]